MNLRGIAVAALGGLASAVLALVVSLPLLVLSVTSLALILVGLGALLTPPVLTLVRWHTGLRRRLDRRWFGVTIEAPYRRSPVLGGGVARLVQLTQWQVTDPATWRELLWLLLDATVGFVLGLGSFLLPLVVVGLWLSPLLMRLATGLDESLLGPTRARALELRVQELDRRRTDVIDVSAAELRRIERDLHDGAQARLVAIGMSLGEIERLMARDPLRAKARLAETRESSARALADLRQLVRGVHPPVLADRGLPDALRALALDSPLQTELRMAVDGRVEAPIESATYFAVAELLTNAAKHAQATRAVVEVDYRQGRLRIAVADDGRGGADPASGSGLHGLQRRFAAFDGRLSVESPPGGPTQVAIEVPCALSGSGR